MKTALVFLLKLGLTAACLWWAFSAVDGESLLFTEPGRTDFRWLAAGVVLAGISVFLTAVRWWAFLKVVEIPATIGRVVELTMIGNLLSLFSIGSVGGDAARIILLSRENRGKKLHVMMSVLVDRMAGMVTLGLLFFFVSAGSFRELTERDTLGPVGESALKLAWLWIGGGFVMVAGFFIFASPPLHRRIHANGRFAKWPMLEKVPEIYDAYRRNWKMTSFGLGTSIVMLVVYFASFWCGLKAVGGEAALGQVMTAMPVIDGLSAIPVSIGGVGIRENLFMMLMPPLADVSRETARDASLAGFACTVFWALLGALFFLKKRDRISAEEAEEK